MTDLERNWDDLSVGPAPVDAVLGIARAEATRAAARRSPGARLRRSLTLTTALGGVAAAFVAGTIVASDDGAGGAGSPGAGADDVAPAAFHGELQAAESCDDLLQRYIERGLDQVSEYGWGGDVWRIRAAALSDSPDDSAALQRGRVPAPYAKLPSTSRSVSGESGTNVQEAGVDEPDLVKTDGTLLAVLRRDVLTTYSLTGAEVSELGRITLPDFTDGEILLTGDTVVAIGTERVPPKQRKQRRWSWTGVPQQTRVVSIDVGDPAEPEITHTVDYDAALTSARLHGDAVRLVLSSGLPDLGFVQPGSDRGKKLALKTNRDLIRDTTLADWVPQQSVDGGEPRDFLDCAQVAVPKADLPLGTMSVVGFTADDPTDVDPLGLAADAPIAYESTGHLYLANSPITFGCWDLCPMMPAARMGADDGTTYVYDFTLDGTAATYVGAGKVDGSLRDRWSIDEYDGVLRLALGNLKQRKDGNAIVLLKADGDELKEIGRVEGMGINEDIQSVRWFDTLALLVTFRRTDPFYAIDLTDQTSPELMGELKIPGFSSYLHPLGRLRVIGVGEGPQDVGQGRTRWGAQVGLFDVSDLTRPKRLDVLGYGANSLARAGQDPRQFTWLPASRTVLTVVYKRRATFVSTLTLDGGTLGNTMTKVATGGLADDVRTVPLPSGKVVLVAGIRVEFFDVG